MGRSVRQALWGYMDIAWLHIAAHGYVAMAWNHCIWIHWSLNDFFAIALDGYMAIQLHHGMAVYGYMTITCNAAISACRIGREWPITCNAVASAWEKGGDRYNHMQCCCECLTAVI